MGRFVQIAMGSGAELSYHLLLARDLGILKHDEYQSLAGGLDEVMRMLFGALLETAQSIGRLRL